VVICLEQGADLHLAQLMPLPLTVSQPPVKSRLVPHFWYRLTWVVREKGPLNGCVCVCVCVFRGDVRVGGKCSTIGRPVGRWVLAARINNLASERGWSAIITSTVRRQGSLSRGCHLLPAAAESARPLSAAAAVWRETAHQQDGARARRRRWTFAPPPGHRSDFAVMSRRRRISVFGHVARLDDRRHTGKRGSSVPHQRITQPTS